MTVVLGEHDRFSTAETNATVRRGVSRIVKHHGFDSSTNENDIAVVELSVELDLDAIGPSIAPICPPNPAHDYDDEQVYIAG